MLACLCGFLREGLSCYPAYTNSLLCVCGPKFQRLTNLYWAGLLFCSATVGVGSGKGEGRWLEDVYLGRPFFCFYFFIFRGVGGGGEAYFITFDVFTVI